MLQVGFFEQIFFLSFFKHAVTSNEHNHSHWKHSNQSVKSLRAVNDCSQGGHRRTGAVTEPWPPLSVLPPRPQTSVSHMHFGADLRELVNTDALCGHLCSLCSKSSNSLSAAHSRHGRDRPDPHKRRQSRERRLLRGRWRLHWRWYNHWGRTEPADPLGSAGHWRHRQTGDAGRHRHAHAHGAGVHGHQECGRLPHRHQGEEDTLNSPQHTESREPLTRSSAPS